MEIENLKEKHQLLIKLLGDVNKSKNNRVMFSFNLWVKPTESFVNVYKSEKDLETEEEWNVHINTCEPYIKLKFV